MIGRINRLTVRYDEGLRKAEGEACRRKDELEEAKQVYEASERSLQEQMDSVKDECKLLLEHKDAELAVAKRELKALQESKAAIEETARSEAWASVNRFLSERFKYVKERLEGLRGDTTMDFVAFMQAKNNLEFLKELQERPESTVGKEKATLEEEMAKYADSEDCFDQTLNQIESALNFLPASPELTVSLNLEETAEPQSNTVEADQAKTPELDVRAAEAETSVPEPAEITEAAPVQGATVAAEGESLTGVTRDRVEAHGDVDQSGAARCGDSSSSGSSSDEEEEA